MRQTSSKIKKPYHTYAEHYQEMQFLLDILLSMHLLKDDQFPEVAEDVTQAQLFRGLVVTDQEVRAFLDGFLNQLGYIPEAKRMSTLATLLTEQREHIQERVRLSQEAQTLLPLAHIRNILQLSPIEEEILFILFAPELDRKYQKIFSYLNDDVTAKHATLEIMELLYSSTEQALSITNLYLLYSPFKDVLAKGEERPLFLKNKPLILKERMVQFLVYPHEINSELLAFTKFSIGKEPHHSTNSFPVQQHKQVLEYIEYKVMEREGQDSSRASIGYITSEDEQASMALIETVAARYHWNILTVDMVRLLSVPQLHWIEVWESLHLEARLYGSILCFQRMEALRHPDHASFERLFFQKVLGSQLILFLCATIPLEQFQTLREEWRMGRPTLWQTAIPSLQSGTRLALWQSLVERVDTDETVQPLELANSFSFTYSQIVQAIEHSKRELERRRIIEGNRSLKLSRDIVVKSCYAQISHDLSQRARRIHTSYGWENLVLPEDQLRQLQHACNHHKYRSTVFQQWGFEQKLSYGKGLSMLFSGPPGTGKTMSAEVIARELSLELYKVNLSQMVSKYIGETEKHIEQLFQEAEKSNAILFFDEGDALFGKRSEVKDSHDKYANLETSFLLQKVEEYQGISILATNYLKNIDEAFIRRINYIIKFPFPDAKHREMLWRGIFPPETPLDEGINFAYLADKLEVSGGNIKNIALSAAFLAVEEGEPVKMRHIIQAALYELQKTGKILIKQDFKDFL